MNSDPKLNREDALDLLPAYVLGALETEETQAIETYIREQQTFFQQLKKIEDAAAMLTHTVNPVPPPANVKRVVMTIARFDAPQPVNTNGKLPRTNGNNSNGNHTLDYSALAAGENGTSDNQTTAVQFALARYTPPTTAIAKTDFVPVAPARRNYSQLTNRLWQAAAAVALSALLAVAGMGLVLNHKLSRAMAMAEGKSGEVNSLLAVNSQLLVEKEQLVGQNQRLGSESEALRSVQTQLAQEIASTQRRMAAISNATIVNQLRTGQNNPAVSGLLYRNGQQGVLMVRGLRSLPATQAYQLWLGNLNQFTPITTFTASESGSLWYDVMLPTDVQAFSRARVTIESAAGSTQPTGPTVLDSQTN